MVATPQRSETTVPFAVITGGSEGIGFAISDRLARDGKSVLLVARDRDRLDAAAGRIRKAGVAGCVDILSLDVTTEGAAQAIEAKLATVGGHLDLLVNCAGIGLGGPFSGQSPEAIAGLLALNVGALTGLMRHFIPELTRRGGGGILNIASLGGYVPGPNQAVYYASKAYVISLSEAVAAEVASSGVRVTVVTPGPVTTEFHARMGAENAMYRRLLPAMSPEAVARWSLLAYRLGLRSVTPGLINCCMMLFLRILPHRLVVPLVQWLLRPGLRETTNA